MRESTAKYYQLAADDVGNTIVLLYPRKAIPLIREAVVTVHLKNGVCVAVRANTSGYKYFRLADDSVGVAERGG